jgi:recombination protein RecA
VVGNRTKIKIVKNKVAAPFREIEVDILYGRGISREGDALDLGALHGVIEKSGSWYSYKGERIGQGRENARQTLIDKPDMRASIETELRQSLGLNGAGAAQKMAPEFELVTPIESKRVSAAS